MAKDKSNLHFKGIMLIGLSLWCLWLLSKICYWKPWSATCQHFYSHLRCLQDTPKDKKASLVIHGLVDKVSMIFFSECIKRYTSLFFLLFYNVKNKTRGSIALIVPVTLFYVWIFWCFVVLKFYRPAFSVTTVVFRRNKLIITLLGGTSWCLDHYMWIITDLLCIYSNLAFCYILYDKQVISGVMNLLNMQIYPFIRLDFFQIVLTQALSIGKADLYFTSINYYSRFTINMCAGFACQKLPKCAHWKIF